MLIGWVLAEATPIGSGYKQQIWQILRHYWGAANGSGRLSRLCRTNHIKLSISLLCVTYIWCPESHVPFLAS
jgi:hypothetical protein